jgi:hypothetical protein
MPTKPSLLNKAKKLPKSKIKTTPGWWDELTPSRLKQVDEVFSAFLAGELAEQLPSKAHLRRWLAIEGLDLSKGRIDNYLKWRSKHLDISERQSDKTTKRQTRAGSSQ